MKHDGGLDSFKASIDHADMIRSCMEGHRIDT